MSSEEFVCKMCNLDYSTWSQFEEHLWSLIHHKQLETKYARKTHTCSICGTWTENLSAYAKHLIGQTHRAAIDERKKRKKLQGASAPSSDSYRNNHHLRQPNAPRGFQGQPRPAASQYIPVPQPERNLQNPRLQRIQQFSQHRVLGDKYVDDSSVHNSFQRSSAQQWNYSSGYGKSLYSGNRAWTPKCDFECTQRNNSHPYTLSRNQCGSSGGIMSGRNTQRSYHVKSGSTQQPVMSKDKVACYAETGRVGGLIDQSAASKSSLNQNTGVKDKTPSSSKPDTAAGSCRGQTAANKNCKPGTATNVRKSSKWDNPVSTSRCLSHGNTLAQDEIHKIQDQTKSSTSQDKDKLPQMVPTAKVSNKPQEASKESEPKVMRRSSAGATSKSKIKPQDDKLLKKDTVVKETTEKPATISDRGSNRMASADDPVSSSTSKNVIPLVTHRLLTSSLTSSSSSSMSAITQSVNSSNPTSIPQRSVSWRSAPSFEKSPPEVTRLNLPRTNSDPGGRESTGDHSNNGANTVNTKPVSESTDDLDEEASVTRVQLPPSLQRELTKLLVKSQAPRPRPNLAAARSRLHAGEHHQPQVVESPDRMIQHLLMKLLDSPKSRDRQVQQIEELQYLLQASKKGSERARFGMQQLPEVSLNALESLLQCGHLKPLLSDDDTVKVTTPDPEHPTMSATGYKHVESEEAEITLNLINTSILDQEHPTSLSAPLAEQNVDSKEAVRALINSTTSNQEHPAMSSAPGSENADSKEALKPLITAFDTPVDLPKQKGKATPEEVNISPKVEHRIVPRIKDEPLPKSKDKPNNIQQLSQPVMEVMVSPRTASGVQLPIDGRESNLLEACTSATANHCSSGRGSSVLKADVATNLSASVGWQLMMPSAPINNNQSPAATPSKKAHLRQKPTKSSEPPADLQEVLLELSLQEELLHNKLGTVESSLKTTKAIIQKKQLHFKKLKEQKHKISKEVLGIRTRRLELLTEATLKSCSASAVSSPAAGPGPQKMHVSGEDLSACTSTSAGADSAQGMWTAPSSRGEQVSNVSVSDHVAFSGPSASGSVCEPTFPGLGKPCLDPSSPTSSSWPRSLSGTDRPSKRVANHQAVVENDGAIQIGTVSTGTVSRRTVTTGTKRKLQQSISDIIPMKKKIANATKSPKKKSANPETTAASHGSDPDTPFVSGNVSLYQATCKDAELRASPLADVQETLMPKKWIKDVKLYRINLRERSEATKRQTSAEQAQSQKTPVGPGVNTKSRTSAGSSRSVGRDCNATRIQTQGSTMPEKYRVFEISSDSENSATQATSYAKTRRLARSRPSTNPAETPQGAGVNCGMFPSHDGSVLGICIANQTLYTAAADCTTRIFDINDFSCKKVLTNHNGDVNCLSVWFDVMDDAYLCTGSSDNTVSVRNTKTLKLEQLFICEDKVVCLLVRCKHLYAAMVNGIVHVFDLKRGEKVKTFMCKLDGKIESMTSVKMKPPAKESNHKCLVIGYEDWTIGVHNMLSGKLLRSLLGHNGPILCMMAHKHLLYSGSADRTVMVHDIKTGQHIRTIWGHGNSVTGIAFQCKTLVTSCLDGKIRHYSKKGAFKRVIAAFPQMIRCMVQWKKMLYIGCTDGTVRAVQFPGDEPSVAQNIKPKTLKQTRFCQWKGCISKVTRAKMYRHLRQVHLRRDNQCLWGMCRAKFTNQHQRKMAEHAHAHLREFFEDFEVAKKSKVKPKAKLKLKVAGKKAH